MRFVVIVLCVIIINLLFDIYIVKQLGKLNNQIYRKLYYTIPLLGVFIPFTAILMFVMQFTDEGLLYFMWLLYSFVVIFLPKTVYVLFSLIGKLCRVALNRCFNILISLFSFSILCLLFYSAHVTLRTPEVKSQIIEYDNLPSDFDGFRIIQISDFHLGSYFSDTDFVADVVTKINEQKPDLILFTGDLVNSLASEATRFQSELSQLNAPYGVWSVLGNHDYGDYYKWESEEQKRNNFERLKNLQRDCGWNLLNNTYTIFNNGKDSMALIGVENWGDFPFPKYGDLQKACEGIDENMFKILMSHNPVHWRQEVLRETNIDLTLSGHTHAMQCVVEFFGKRWSPAALRYEEWGGLYGEGDRKLYVNAGLGFVGLPIRIGVNPEITLITLKKK